MQRDHVIAGVRALYKAREASERAAQATAAPATAIANVTHFIAAEEVEGDYAPLGHDGCNGEGFGQHELGFTKAGELWPGSRSLKVMCPAYTGGRFVQRKRGGADKQFSGVVGQAKLCGITFAIRAARGEHTFLGVGA
ncbi:Ceruloplasmin [Gracilariopsis chorda]|uniref:Ceruloplasmin n=1 Tax=Gracilariopsis chorda TaxID=448386 RepID=A0A2V3IJF1_9FLOR|nr:Ceruloplasmin [Gracilariopsis chorda]|eukprot:PXF42226.1 Ceruloplasmin [Gracilariopsis chorda]